MMQSNKYYSYYDSIYSEKDYQREVENIIGLYQRYSTQRLINVLDVGCGTGNHSIVLAKKSYNVLGVDTDPNMILQAQRKLNKLQDFKVSFVCSDIGEVENSGFQLAFSLFNVINYILDISDLVHFFGSIQARLGDEGIFVFDCWNGLAAILDPPREKTSTLKLEDGTRISNFLEPKLDLFDQMVTVRNLIDIDGPNGKDHFEYTFKHALWTPKCLKDCLYCQGFEVLKVFDIKDWGKDATEKNWKIGFVCKKADTGYVNI